MSNQNSHLLDEELLLCASGEPSASDAQVRAHLDSCFRCRGRLCELEDSLCEFREVHLSTRADLPHAGQARLALQSRLAELTAKNEQNRRRSPWLLPFRSSRTFALAGLALAACLVIVTSLRRSSESHPAILVSTAYPEKPDLRLTPGATIPVSQSDICGPTEAAPPIPISLAQRVFKLYKVTQSPDQFEVDYLITPELGGATDIRNLWPEPYHDALWNAHVKDQLEDRLHRMVCRGDLDLATAQRDISTDWIAAYRKYFHTDRPIADGATTNFSSRRKLLPLT